MNVFLNKKTQGRFASFQHLKHAERAQLRPASEGRSAPVWYLSESSTLLQMYPIESRVRAASELNASKFLPLTLNVKLSLPPIPANWG